MTDADVSVHVDQATVELKGAQPGINMPDHPIRHTAWYQAFERLWRPASGWVTAIGLAYAFIIGPATGRPLADAYLLIELAFAAAVLGLKTYEKRAGLS